MKVKTSTGTNVTEQATVETEISKVTVIAITAVSAAIGVWGLACFIGGMVASGGPLAFIGSWFRAVSGM
jgi:hypothetical protein